MYHSIAMISMIYDIYIRIWFEMMQVILASHSMSQCFRCWIDIIIMTTWTCHCIDHIRCCTCLNFNITSSSRSNSWYRETYSWTIQICRIPIDELMHFTWNKINDWFPGWQHEQNRSPHGTIVYVSWGSSFPQKRPSMMNRGLAPRNEQVFI